MIYDYTYNPKSKILVSNTTNEKWDLTKRENDLLMLLIEKQFISKEEVGKKLTGLYDKNNFNTVQKVKSRLCIKTEIKIKTKTNMGYRLISKIELKEGGSINGY